MKMRAFWVIGPSILAIALIMEAVRTSETSVYDETRTHKYFIFIRAAVRT
jgi:hypothetical protein